MMRSLRMGLMRSLRAGLRSPYVSNCLSYGSLFCGAEVAQQLVIRKYQPWSQVSCHDMRETSCSQ